MPAYPIRAVARLTHISEYTLRAWERRYRAVTPRRSNGGRIYTDKQIERLVLLQQLVSQGHSIGQIASITDDRLRALLSHSKSFTDETQLPKTQRKRKPASLDDEAVLEPLLNAIEDYDYLGAERELGRLTAATPSPRYLVHRLGIPLMRVAGERWHEGKFAIAQQHMITALLSGLFASLLRLYSPKNPPAKVLMATPENEHHGFGVLAAAMLTAAGGLGAIHLGTNLPARDVVQAAKKTQADAVLIGLSATKGIGAIAALREIRKGLAPRIQLWLGGANTEITAGAARSGWTVLEDFRALERQLELLGARF
jgi:MerR family transcriptional regulator, light-induced transcriptional regulator